MKTSTVSAVLLGLMLAASAAPSASAQPARPSARINALVIRGAANPVLPALRHRLGGRLQVDRTSARPGSRAAPGKLGRYRLLIVDGDNLAPGEMARRGEISRFTTSHRWVLAFDLRRNHFRRALNRQTGFSARGRNGKRTRVFLFRRTMVVGSPRIQMIQASSFLPQRAGHLPKRRRRSLARRQAARVAALVHRVVLQGVSGAVPGSPQDDGGVPPELQHVGWSFTQVGQQSLPDAYWTKNQGPPHSVSVPGPGSQTATWSITHNFDVYLDNSESHPQGNYQLITYDVAGEFTPKLPSERFFHMYDKFGVGLAEYYMERAWWTGLLGVNVTPGDGTGSQLDWQASQPETPNAQTEYKSGNEFSVGFSGSKNGGGIDASYKVSNDKQYSIPNWGVENQGSGNKLAWRFSARGSPAGACDARPDHYSEAGCFHECFLCDGTPLGPPSDLSLGQLQVHASGRWKTKGLLQPGSQLSFAVKTPVQLEDNVCKDWGVAVCAIPARVLDRHYMLADEQNYSFDPGIVNPIPITSVGLAPNPADGTAGQKVTGTVNLGRATGMDTNVVIYSSSANAVVGPPINGGPGSQRTITVPKGQAKVQFTIQTNDNKLSPGQHTTAAITAFYSEPTTVQLRIEAH